MIWTVEMDYHAWDTADQVGIGAPHLWRYYVEAENEMEARRKVLDDRATRMGWGIAAPPVGDIKRVYPGQIGAGFIL